MMSRIAILVLFAAALGLMVCQDVHASPSQLFDPVVDAVPSAPQGAFNLEVFQGNVAKGHDQTEDDGQIPTNHISRSSFRLTYTLLDGLDLLIQPNLARGIGQGYEYAGIEGGLHLRLWQGKEWALGAALELEDNRAQYVGDDTQPDVDFHPIIQWTRGRWSLIANPIVEYSLSRPTGQGVEFDYNMKASYRWLEALSPSIEFYGEGGKINKLLRAGDASYYLVPSIDSRFGALSTSVGLGVGLTSGSDQLFTLVRAGYQIGGRK